MQKVARKILILVLVKPNLLKPAEADSAVTTHPAVLRAVLRMLEEYGCANVRFGDSPGQDTGAHALERLGFRADEPVFGARLAPMTEEVHVDFPEGLTEKEFWFAKEVTEADAVLVLRHVVSLVFLSGDALLAADFTGDGTVDAADAAAILRYVMGLK